MQRIIEISAALLTPLIAIIAAYIAWRQHRTARDRLRLDLYDRRFAVFAAARAFIAHVLTDAQPSIADIIDFRTRTREATLLFRSEVPLYLDRLAEHAIELRRQNSRLSSTALSSGSERTSLEESSSEILARLEKETREMVHVFRPYLDVNPS